MKKYRNKHTGEEVESNVHHNNFYITQDANIIPKRFIENSCDWEEVREVILTTFDGVELFYGDDYYVPQVKCGEYSGHIYQFQLSESTGLDDGSKRFSSLESANAYVERRKNYKTVCGSQIVEGQKFYVYCDVTFKNFPAEYGRYVNEKWDGKRYKTCEEVDESVALNKPQYSLISVLAAVNNWSMSRVDKEDILNFLK